MLGIDYFFGDTYAKHLNEPGFDCPTWREKSVRQAKEYTPGWVEAVKQRYGECIKHAHCIYSGMSVIDIQ